MWNFLKKNKTQKRKILYSDKDLFLFYVQCEKCDEKFRVIIRKHSELFHEWEGSREYYAIHKEIIGSKCNKEIIVDLKLTPNFKIFDHAIKGGKFLTKEEFEAAQAHSN